MRSRFRAPSLLVALLSTAALITACGDDDDGGGGGSDAQQLTFVIGEKGGKPSIEAPESAEAGIAEITLQNDGEQEHSLDLIRAEGDHSAAEVVRALGGAFEGKPIPDWFHAAGGAPTAKTGASETVTQELKPGTYFVFDTTGSEGPPGPADVPSFEVTGEVADAELPEADATVKAFEYGFEAEGLTAGETTILFENAGAQPHHLLAAPIAKGKTFADVEAFLENEQGPPPVDEENEVGTAVLDGGESQVVTLDLKPGNYALLCFISDREGGPPHAFKGMVVEAEVAG